MIKNQFYRSIPGDFTFTKPYDDIVAMMDDNESFIEVGSLLGSSITYFTHAMLETDKRFHIYAVDSWCGADDEPAQQAMIATLGGNNGFYEKFLKNLEEGGIEQFVKPIRALSVDAANQWANETVRAIYLDAGHSYKDISADIKAYWPKVKKGGLLAGHDYFRGNDVERAVQEFLVANQGYVLDFKIYYLSRTWLVTKAMEYFD